MSAVAGILGVIGVTVIVGGLAVLVYGAAGPDRAPVEEQP